MIIKEVFVSLKGWLKITMKKQGVLSMAESNQTVIAKQYNDLIGKLPGVMNSSIVFSQNEIAEIHVLADTHRAPKQISRDIQSAIMAQFGVNIDYKVISIAQIPAENDLRLHNRLIFDEISMSRNKERSSATVSLSDADSSFSGTASSLNDCLEVNKMICQATLNAVENFIDENVLLSVADVKTFDLSGEKAVAVCIAVKSKSNVDRMIGSSFIGDDSGTAVVKATMDALNRRIATA